MKIDRVPLLLSLLSLLGTAFPVSAQQRVDDRNYGERLIVIVPLVGTGSHQDPIRPLFVPKPEDMKDSGITSFTMVLSDDKRSALVEFVATDRKVFDAMLKDTRPEVKKFDPVKGARKEDIEAEFRKIKTSFNFADFKAGK